MKKLILGFLIIGIFILSGCAQQQTKYVCPDGSTSSDISLCKQVECKSFSDGTCRDTLGKHELLSEEEFSFCKDNSVYEMTFKCTNNACEKILAEVK